MKRKRKGKEEQRKRRGRGEEEERKRRGRGEEEERKRRGRREEEEKKRRGRGEEEEKKSRGRGEEEEEERKRRGRGEEGSDTHDPRRGCTKTLQNTQKRTAGALRHARSPQRVHDHASKYAKTHSGSAPTRTIPAEGVRSKL